VPIGPETLDPDPFRQFELWLEEARAAGLPLPDAFALATADGNGVPSLRMLLLRGHGPDGFRFYTNRASRKGRDLAANPQAAALFHWPVMERQVRISGVAEPLGERESAAYFASRPRGSQLSAWVSQQGEPVGSRAVLEGKVADADARFPGDIPLPDDWGGYRLVADRFEFWLSRADRLHDRVEYVRQTDGAWTRRRLQP
jgi:pyridoxamine 5'-phosphate oxidase